MSAQGTRTFLLEIGCEEIPAAILPAALEDLGARLLAALEGEGLSGRAGSPAPLGGPRRLVALITGVVDRAPDRAAVVMGPPVAAAFDRESRPTKAALGFAKAQGVEIGALERVKGERGEVVAARKTIVGRTSRAVLAEACPKILSAMRFPKTMKWGDKGYSFVRPVQWILALLDDEVVPFEFVGVRSGRLTHGHRFLAPGPHEIPSAALYETILAERGKVLAGNAVRRDRIARERDRAAAAMGWRAREDAALLEELTFLTEYPGVITGTFPREFLELPEPVIVTAMRHHQKYFPAEEEGGGLAPGFLAVINADADRDGAIQRGNEWVLKARLADARFFWVEDRKKKLEERLPDLARLSFHEKLGNYLQRSERLEQSARGLAEAFAWDKVSAGNVAMAARLSKTDLMTGMVAEFPELQGTMGGIYARRQGLEEKVAQAIAQQYIHAPPEDHARWVGGMVLALADKIDLLVGCFAASLIPKGSADPYGLRRAALGVCRIAGDESGLTMPLPIDATLLMVHALYRDQQLLTKESASALAPLKDFIGQRLEHLMTLEEIEGDTARAVLATGWDDIRDTRQRAMALHIVRQARGTDFEALAVSSKRIRNIMKQAIEKGAVEEHLEVDVACLKENEELELHRAVREASAQVEEQIAGLRYVPALTSIAALRPQVDRFFDKVLVMAPDERLRRNRLALLQMLSGLLIRVADFSEIVVEGERAEANA